MKQLLAIALTLPLAAACTVGTETDPVGTEHDEDPTPADPNPNTDGLTIAADTTWSGTHDITVPTTIAPGVTVTVAAGTTLQIAPTANVLVNGTLKIQGTSAAKVTVRATTGSYHGGFKVGGMPTAGTFEASYLVQDGGGIVTNPGSTTTLTDSKMWNASGDFLIMYGGAVTATYSQFGADPGDTDTTHCNIHTAGAALDLEITNSNIAGVPYGLMLYGGQNAVLTSNNWFGNTAADVDTNPRVSADLSGSWFDGEAPVAVGGATLTLDNLATARIPGAGVRP